MENQRRRFIKATAAMGAVIALSEISLIAGCKEKESEEKEVSPPEDLMQEHGLLNRILLIYDFAKVKLIGKESFPIEAISQSANIVRTFVEDYHEKQEENY